MRTHRQPGTEQTAAAPQWDCTVLAAGRARGLAGKTSASLEPAACAPCAPRQWCALRAGLRPPLTRCSRRSYTDPHRQLGRRHNPPQGGLHALTPTPSTTLQAYAAPTPRRRSRSPKRPVTIRRNVGHVQPKRPVTFAEIRIRERYASISECRNPLPWRGRRVSAIADTTRIICRARDRRGYGRLLVERWKYRDVRAIRYRVVRIVPRH